MLLFNGHASYVTVDAIKYCEENKIILFCLLRHSTHLLQPLDVGVFSPFATAYRRILLEKTKWGTNYQIPKDLFLEIVQQARIESITPDNVRSLWKKTSLFLYNPKVVIQDLPSVILAKASAIIPLPASTALSQPITAGGPFPSVIATLIDVGGVQALMAKTKVITNKMQSMLDEVKELKIMLEKISHSATSALTQNQLTQAHNADLVAAQNQLKKKRRGVRK